MTARISASEDMVTDRRPSEREGRSREGFLLRALEGADSGATFLLADAQPRVLLGKSSACVVRLTDPQVSRRHAAFTWEGEQLHVSDLASSNGTYVNGLRINDAWLAGGEIIRVGQTELRVEPVEAEPPSLSPARGFGRVVGGSPDMRKLYPLCERIARSDVSVVIEGESGTGKEVLAESLHEASARAGSPFIVFDCTTVAASLVESELFGHERGAFTGAVSSRRGVFEQAQGGTLFLDEIGELDLPLQAKLLRALERREVRRVGGDGWMKIDARILAATRRDLDREVQEGRFRDDLFFRLNVARIELPPLRRRTGDVQLLAEYFRRQLGGGDEPLPYEVVQRFERHDWPGNVRELRNAVARQLALGDLAELRGSSFPRALEGADSADPFARVLASRLPYPRARDAIVSEFERAYVEDVLAQHGGNVARAAEASGIARRYFNQILARTRR
jgi:DNA-binding NtrC family response regulator